LKSTAPAIGSGKKAARAGGGTLFISIAAGVTIARLQSRLGAGARVIRVMPNAPALLGKGMSVLVRGRHATAADERLGLRLLRAVGQAVAVSDERVLDAVTGLSGSGPAYVYLFAEGLIAGGVNAGLPRPLATLLALQTLSGAAAMLQEAGESPEALRALPGIGDYTAAAVAAIAFDAPAVPVDGNVERVQPARWSVAVDVRADVVPAGGREALFQAQYAAHCLFCEPGRHFHKTKHPRRS
jgi:pyrroline-5-carboxylate reductase